MSIMICITHGRVGFVETRSHIAKWIDAGKVLGGRRLTIGGNLFVCDDCFDSLGFEKFASMADLPLDEAVEITDGRWEAAYNALEGRQVFCLKCITDSERQPSAV